MTQTLHFEITDLHQGKRLDRYLADVHPDLTRTHLKTLILKEAVSLDQQIVTDPSLKVKEGQRIHLVLPTLEEPTPTGEDLPLDILYEEEEFLVLNKAAGMVVHPAYGHGQGTLVNALLHHCDGHLSGIRGVKMPGIVHRLDKDTSGLMVIAKSDRAHQALTQQFQERTLSRRYKALVYGVPSPSEGQIEGNIGRHPGHRQKMALLQHGGKEALTHYKILEVFSARASLLECALHSGRTHQIRVHMTSMGHPLVGDPLYGRSPKWLHTETFHSLKLFLQTHEQQALHAYALRFAHPLTQQDMQFETPLPSFMTQLMDLLSSPSA